MQARPRHSAAGARFYVSRNIFFTTSAQSFRRRYSSNTPLLFMVRGRRGRPCTDVRGQERAFQNALALGHGARPERELLPRRPDLHGHGRVFFEIDDADADMGAPFSADAFGRDVDGAHIRAPDPLDGDGARDPAVGRIVVGNVQGALLGKSVVRDDFERVLPLRRAAAPWRGRRRAQAGRELRLLSRAV